MPNKKSANITTIFDENLDEFVGLDAANLINNYFSSIGKNLADNIDMVDCEFWPIQTDVKFDLGHSITDHDILYSIDDFSPSKSSGIKELSSRILLAFFKIKPDIMANLFNKCLTSGIYPSKIPGNKV